MEAHIPFILSIFSNPPEDAAGHLSFLDEEEKQLEKLITNFKKTSDFHIEHITLEDKPGDNLDSREIADTIRDYKKKLTVIHYSGHADQVTLSLNAGDVRAENLVRYIGDCEKVKLVVLNGCSTQGFVKLLLETTGVKAVIATNNPVRDDRAMKFSVDFYKSLLERQPVARAFTGALAYALDNNNYKPDQNIYQLTIKDNKTGGVNLLADMANPDGTRDLKRREVPVLDNNETMATWGIYTRVQDVLNWNLFESATESEKKIQAIDQRLLQKETQGFQLENSIEEIKTFIDLLTEKNDPGIKQTQLKEKKEKDLAEAKAALEKVQNDIELLHLEKQDIAEDKIVEELIQTYINAVPNLNYQSQLNKYRLLDEEGVLKKNNYSCFILHGDKGSGLHLLSRRLRDWIDLRDEKKAIFDFNSIHMGDFWEKLQTDMLGRVISDKPENIVKELATHYRDKGGKTKNNFLLIFRYTKKDDQSMDVFNKVAFNFWKEFVTTFRKHDTIKEFDHSIYAFVIDDSCEVLCAQDSYTGSREAEYHALYAMDPDVGTTFRLMPVVEPLKTEDIIPWLLNSKIRKEYRQERAALELLMKDTKGVFANTIRKLCIFKINNELSKKRIINNIIETIDKPISV